MLIAVVINKLIFSILTQAGKYVRPEKKGNRSYFLCALERGEGESLEGGEGRVGLVQKYIVQIRTSAGYTEGRLGDRAGQIRWWHVMKDFECHA